MSFLSDIFYPRYCFFCLQKGKYICSSCLEKLVYYDKPCCPVCKGVLRSKKYFIHKICISHSYLDGSFPIVHYDRRSKIVLKEAKYHFAYQVLTEIAKMMKSVYSNLPFAVDLVTAVPLSRSRTNWRGFNQAFVLAKKLNWRSREILKKEKHTTAQAKLHRRDRLINLEHSFSLLPEFTVEGKIVVIIDDVCTTGATLQECAKVLKDNGAKKVFALVWAKD